MLYHIRILLPKEMQSRYKLDVTEKILMKRIVTPYKNGQSFTLSGKTIAPTDIKEIQIVRTEKSSEELMPSIRAKIQADQEASGVGAAIPDEYYLMEHGTDVTDELLTQPPKSSSDKQAQEVSNTVTSDREVFVVHGRNDKINKAMFDFLHSIDLKPTEWAKAIQLTGKSAPYVGQVLDAALPNAQAVIVLLTPDDIVYLRESLRHQNDPPYESEPTPQARPNVLFEAGMAMGRRPERTIIVQIGNLRPFSDISGIHLINIDSSTSWRKDMANRLQSAGCAVDLSGTEWLTAGVFEFEEPNEEELV